MYIKIDIKIFILIAIAFLAKNIEMYLLLIIFTLIHEIGHLLAGFILGFKAKGITIAPYGINIVFKINYSDYNKKICKANILAVKRIIIALAGPMTNIIIAIIINIFTANNINLSMLGFNNQQMIYANLIIAIFNMLPVYPLDGGRIIKEVIQIFKGLKKSYIYIKDISYICCSIITAASSIIILMYKNILILIMICYLWMLVINIQQQIEMKLKVYKYIEK